MNIVARAVAVAFVGVCIAACGKGTAAGPAGGHASGPYLGAVNVRIHAPDGVREEKKDTGTGSVHFVETARGRTRLVVVGHIRKEADAGFVIDGIESSSGWSGRSDNVQLAIGQNGKISGGGTVHPHRFRFDGSMSDQRFDLEVELELLEATGKGLPPGTKFLFSYRLRRESGLKSSGVTAAKHIAGHKDSDIKAARHRSKSNRKCKRTIWQMRNIANLSGGPMVVVQVPQCVNW